ncbi:hypothetical protein [Rhodococcus sp. NPDC058521]|uniref:hypothetical protein n=1 Tax=Rhodococcus sp. NPDC058521 TaxID=3346536 RepID=UPI003650FE96
MPARAYADRNVLPSQVGPYPFLSGLVGWALDNDRNLLPWDDAQARFRANGAVTTTQCSTDLGDTMTDTKPESPRDTTMWCAMMGKRRQAASAIVLAAILASCGTASDEQGPPTEPEVLPSPLYTFRWSADPTVDLFSRGAELVRAAYEAGELNYFRGIDHSFPGYRKAIGGPVDHLDPDKMDSVGLVEPAGTPVASTNVRRITDFSATDTSVGATLCTHKLYAHESDNTLSPRFGPTRIELENTSEETGPPGIADDLIDAANPEASVPPTWNVFGTWKITRFESIPSSETPPECTRWWLSQFPELTTNPETELVSIPEGFRAPTQPVAVQYPEWIGAADNE